MIGSFLRFAVGKGLPVLMYHKVGDDTRPFLNVSQERFAEQMQLFASAGFKATTFEEALTSFNKGRLPENRFVVTFDDAYQCVIDFALPVLARHNWPATVFTISHYLGASEAQTARGYDWPPLAPITNEEGLALLASKGWEIAGHTRSHPHLDRLSDDVARSEIAGGREDLQGLGYPARTFCYPFGHFNDRTPGLVREAGFLGSCTVQSGVFSMEDDPFLIPRVKPSQSDTAFLLTLKTLRSRLRRGKVGNKSG